MRDLRHRYLYLDGLRGVAALAVVLFHIGVLLNLNNIALRGYLAVDFFFLLSGFVLASAYEKPLLAGRLSFRQFLRLRILRLYPMIVFGVSLGLIVSLVKLSMTGHLNAASLGWAYINGVLLLPFGALAGTSYIFPLDPPLWSLLYEALANALYGGAIRILSSVVLAPLMGVGAVAAIVAAYFHGSFDVGSTSGLLELAGGSGRVCLSFFAGVMLFRFQDRLARFSMPSAICTIALVAIFTVPVLPKNLLVDTLCIGLIFPAIILSGTRTKVSETSASVYKFLGDISYPIYAIHIPVLRIFLYVQVKYGLTSKALAASIVIEFLVTIIAAYVALRLYDEPVRRYLGSSRVALKVSPAVR